MPTQKELLEQQKRIQQNRNRPKRKPAPKKADDDAGTKAGAADE